MTKGFYTAARGMAGFVTPLSRWERGDDRYDAKRCRHTFRELDEATLQRYHTVERCIPMREANNAKVRQVQDMGDNIGPAYYAIWNEIITMRLKWAEYRKLFATSEEQVVLLNESASLFFWLVQDSLLNDVLLYLNRLTDPALTYGKSNLSVRILPELCDTRIKEKVRTLVGEAVNTAEFARDHRNLNISHRDLELALGTRAKPLPTITRDKIDAAMDALHEVVNYIHVEMVGHNVHPELCYGPGGAESLLHVLRLGRSVRDAWREGLNEGEDLESLPPI